MKYYICAIIKDEQMYLEEWIQHHLNIGFTDIYLFEDYKSTSHKDITDKYDKVHLDTCNNIFILKKSMDVGTSRQIRLYNNFLYKHKDDNAWCAFIDPDEYIILDNELILDDIVNEYHNYAGVGMFWKMFNANGHIWRPEGKIMDNYTKQTIFLKQHKPWNFKSFVNIKKCKYIIDAHSCRDVVDIDKKYIYSRKINEAKYQKIWINHYYTKSLEDWAFQITKRGDLAIRCARTFKEFFDLNPDIKQILEEKNIKITNNINDINNIFDALKKENI